MSALLVWQILGVAAVESRNFDESFGPDRLHTAIVSSSQASLMPLKTAVI